MKSQKQRLLTILLLVILYGVGVAGLLYKPTNDLFKSLVPFQLIVSAIILFYFHKDWRKSFIIWALVVYFAGVVIELIGVHSGFIFGKYTYGETLGIKIFEVPLIIGLNWLILIYCTGNMLYKTKMRRIYKSFFGALLMVLIDLTIEPVAIYFDFWDWASVDIPMRNYFAWFVISYFLLLSYYYTHFRKSNKIAPALYLIMLAFFSVLNILI